jgi:uncharacterized protein (TIGR02117 family)
MRRWALGLGVVLLALFWILGVATVLTTRYGDRMLWPPRPDAGSIEIYVVSNGYHTGVALPRAALAEYASGRGYPALIAVAQRFNRFPWLEIGWGDEEFYRKVPTVGDLTLPIALRALFSPGNRSVLHVVGVPGDPVSVFASAELVAIPLSRNGFDQLLAKLDATFVPPQGGALPDLGKGLYGPSLFYRAVGNFSVVRVCNHWIGDLLDAAGLPTTPLADTFASGLLLDLRWRAGLRPVERTQ